MEAEEKTGNEERCRGMSGHLLEVNHLTVDFATVSGDIHAVRDVSFYLDKGETLSIVGESGCGKSVTTQALMHLNEEPPCIVKSESILYKGTDISRLNEKQLRSYRGKEFSYIFQDAMTSLNPVARVGRQMVEAIRTHEDVSREEAKARAIEMLGKVGIANPEESFTRYPHTFSGGQRQRIMIAMALCCHPSVLIADEPTTALDVTTQAQILKVIRDLQKETGCSVILITHNLGVVARNADRVAVMYAGKIIETGTLNDIFYHPKHPYAWGLLGSMPDRRTKESARLTAIPGTPPDLYAPPKGCGFAARCPYCMDVCLENLPHRYHISESHDSCCWLMDERCTESMTVPQGREKELINDYMRNCRKEGKAYE